MNGRSSGLSAVSDTRSTGCPSASSSRNCTPKKAPGAGWAVKAPSIRATLRHRSFRSLWIASAVYFIANAMHGMAASLADGGADSAPFLAALVQTAVFLPMFVLALPAGVLADTTDRGG
jgi:hypothetical protein